MIRYVLAGLIGFGLGLAAGLAALDVLARADEQEWLS